MIALQTLFGSKLERTVIIPPIIVHNHKFHIAVIERGIIGDVQVEACI